LQSFQAKKVTFSILLPVHFSPTQPIIVRWQIAMTAVIGELPNFRTINYAGSALSWDSWQDLRTNTQPVKHPPTVSRCGNGSSWAVTKTKAMINVMRGSTLCSSWANHPRNWKPSVSPF